MRSMLGRREFWRWWAGVAGVLGSPAWFDLAVAAGDVEQIDPNYPLGVAAGDPLSARRGDLDPGGAATPTRRVAVTWEVAADPSFRRVVRRGRIDATAASTTR